MRIEAYLFVPWQGQYRFAFNNFGGHQFMKSNEEFDYLWGPGLRRSPTLHELTEGAVSLRATWPQCDASVLRLYRQIRGQVVANRRAKFRGNVPDLEGAYVEFVRI